jgi:hypothetical protein
MAERRSYATITGTMFWSCTGAQWDVGKTGYLNWASAQQAQRATGVAVDAQGTIAATPKEDRASASNWKSLYHGYREPSCHIAG